MKKINFSDKFGLTEAVLSGRKTQTRRIVKRNQLFKRDPDGMWTDDEKEAWGKSGISESDFHSSEDMHDAFEWLIAHASYKVGEVVAVAQAYNDFYNDECDPRIFPSGAGWTNKMFVRADLMPHQIRITNVRVERLQDISDEDCIKEGIVEWDATEYNYQEPISQPITEYHIICKETSKGILHLVSNTPKGAFAELMHKLKRGIWESNPWVFVYDFELVR